MGQVESVAAGPFEGMRAGMRTGVRSERRRLEQPRDVLNMIVDENGHLAMPAADSTLIHTFGSGTRLHRIANFAGIRTGILFQVGVDVYVSNTQGGSPASTPTSLLTLSDPQPVWTVDLSDALYVGNEAQTWKVTWDGANYVTTDITGNANMVNGFHSAMHRGRRFVVDRLFDVWYSDLNQPETFQSDSFFTVGGDDFGSEWSTAPGSVVRLQPHADWLAVFCTQAIYLFTGTTIDTFAMRRARSNVGVWARDSVVPVQEGILFFGGTPRGEMGVYLFDGHESHPVSQGVDKFFRRWAQVDFPKATSAFVVATEQIHAERWNNLYLLSAEPVGDADGSGREVWAYDFVRDAWTTFDGWSNGPRLGLARGEADELWLSRGLEVRKTLQPFARAPGASASVTLGWHDFGLPAGLFRFYAVKLSAWRTGGTGTTSVDVAVQVDGDGPSTSETLQLGDDAWDGLVAPVRLRGQSAEVQLTFTPTSDDEQVVLERVELLYSRKGDKVSRG